MTEDEALRLAEALVDRSVRAHCRSSCRRRWTPMR